MRPARDSGVVCHDCVHQVGRARWRQHQLLERVHLPRTETTICDRAASERTAQRMLEILDVFSLPCTPAVSTTSLHYHEFLGADILPW